MLKIGVTGHRLLLNEEEVKQNIFLSLRYFQEKHGDIAGITALATGGDTLFAKAMKELGKEIEVILPFSRDEYLKDFETWEQKAEFDELLEESIKIDIVSDQDPGDMPTRNKAYLAAGMRVVDEADIVLAIWDKQEAAGIGGTADVVAYARSSGKEVHIIKGIRKEAPVNDSVEDLFEKIDSQAIRYKEVFFQPIWLIGLVTAVLAVLCFASIVSFLHSETPLSAPEEKTKFVLAILEVIFLTLSFILLRFFANKWKHRFLNKRRTAEYLRSLIWFRNAEMPVSPFEYTYDESIDGDFKKVLAVEQELAGKITQIGDEVNAKRILWCHADDQEQYHRKNRVDKFKRNIALIHGVCEVIKMVFLGAVACKFVIEMMEHAHLEAAHHPAAGQLLSICIFTVIVLPSFYAMLEGIKYFGDWKRKIRTSEQIIADLTILKKKILSANNEGELTGEAKMLRGVLDRENLDWFSQYLILDIGPII